MFKKLLQILFLVVLVAGCEQASSTLVNIPNVSIDCQLSAGDSSVAANVALVLISKSGCENDFEIPAASTPGIVCSGSGCSGLASSWIDSTSYPVTEIITGSYDLCILIDSDNSGNTGYTTGDIVYEDSVFIDSSSTISASGSSWRVVN